MNWYQAVKNAGDGAIRLPVKIEEVTAAWLTEALSVNYPGVEVVSANLDGVLWGTGTKVAVRVEYNRIGRESGLPGSLIVKGGFSEHRRVMQLCYLLEVRFYRDLLPNSVSMRRERISPATTRQTTSTS